MAAAEVVIGGTKYTIAGAHLQLHDSVSGYAGSGKYTISVSVASGSPQWFITYGDAPQETTALINLAQAVVTPTGLVFLSDKRNRQVTIESVNAAIAHTPFSDGSTLQDGVVTIRTLGGDVLALFDEALTGSSEPSNPREGELFYNTTTGVFEVYHNGAWVPIGGSGAGVTTVDGKTGPISIQAGTALVTIDDSVAGVIKIDVAHDALANLTDVAESSLANGQVLTYDSTSGKWKNAAAPAGGSVDGISAATLVAGPNQSIADNSPGAGSITLAPYGIVVNGDTNPTGVMNNGSGPVLMVPLI